MKGAILGDIIGSRFEFSPLRLKKTENFGELLSSHDLTKSDIEKLLDYFNYFLIGKKDVII